MPENIVPQIVYDLLADNVGVLDLISQTESRIQGGKQGQAAVKATLFMSPAGMLSSIIFKKNCGISMVKAEAESISAATEAKRFR